MTGIDPKTLDALQKAFAEFKAEPRFQLQVKLRRHRMTELRELLANPDAFDLDTFNREVWRLETYSEHNGRDITGVIYGGALSPHKPLEPDQVAELDAALDAGEIHFHGNSIWGSATRVYGSMLKVSESEKITYIHQALTILNDETRSPLEKARQIIAVPGFGPNIATGLVMIYHPTEFTLFNTPPKTVLEELGFESKTIEAFQASMKTLRDQLQAQDFLELDWFLYLISQGIITLEVQTRYWWVNQGINYTRESAEQYIFAGTTSPTGKTLQHHQNVARLQPGDVIFHYAKGNIRAVSQVTKSYQVMHRPNQSPDETRDPEGYLVRSAYTELDDPIPLQDIPVHWRNLEGGPFTKTGSVNQGYLYPISKRFAERLGSRYTDRMPSYVPRGTLGQRVWIFQANPHLFDLQTRLAEIEPGDEETWTVTRYESEMQEGDIALIWQAGPAAGIYAIAELTGTFVDREPIFDPQRGSERAAEMRYKERLAHPITRHELKRHPTLQNLQILRSAQGTNFKVTEEEWQALQPLLLKPLINVPSYSAPLLADIEDVLTDEGLRLPNDKLRQYHLALQTSRFVILAGNSGTGKTWLAEAYAKAVDAEYIIVPVAPNWTTNEDLLGYQNPIDQAYYDTPFSMFLRRSAAEYQHARDAGVTPRPYHLVLDEMNLARVEYYFARFLSAMEITARGGEGRIELSSDDVLFLPPTLHFIGTVNVDETTHSFADKVYDRAQLIQLDAPRDLIAEHLGSVEYSETLLQIWDALQTTAPFSFRVIDQIRDYICAAEEYGVPWTTALDEQLLHKVLPKIKGAEPHVGSSLMKLQEISRDQFPRTHAKVIEMYDRFNHHGFTSYF